MPDKSPVEKNHFIPCYWSAYWNMAYLASKRNSEKTKVARQVDILYFNIKAGEILNDKTKNVFIDKYQGITTLEAEEDLKKLQGNIISHNNYSDPKNNSGLLIWDFENHFTVYENLSKPSLKRTIESKKIKDIEDKTFLAQFFVLQTIRNPITLNNRLQFLEKQNKNKLDLLLEIRDCFTNRKKLENLIIPLVNCQWILYVVEESIFPLRTTQYWKVIITFLFL